jgi:hypothetical protein
VLKIANDPTTKCAEVIAALLKAAAEKDGAALSYDPAVLYDRIEKEAGFQLKKMKDSGEANRVGNKRVIYVASVTDRGLQDNPRLLNHTLNGYAATVLAELMHHAKASGLYDDRTLSRAILSFLTPNERVDHPLPNTSDIETNSKYFHALFSAKCFESR